MTVTSTYPQTWQETFTWLKSMETPDFAKQTWYKETKEVGRPWLHHDSQCGLMLATANVLAGDITDKVFSETTLCVHCGCNFIGDGGAVTYIQTRELHQIHFIATQMAEIPWEREAVTWTALYSLLVNHITGILLEEVAVLGPICPGLQRALRETETAIEQCRNLHNLDRVAALRETATLRAKNSTAATEEQSEMVFYSLTNAPIIKLCGRDLTRSRYAPPEIASAVMLLGLKVCDTYRGIGELPRTAAEWLLQKATPPTGRVEILDFPHQTLSQEQYEMALALWSDGQTIENSPYHDAGASVRAAAKL